MTECDHPADYRGYGIVKTVSGHEHVTEFCFACHCRPSGAFVSKDEVRRRGINVENLEVVKDNRSPAQPCEVCGAPETELHHWAPVHLFDDANAWPMGYLCCDQQHAGVAVECSACHVSPLLHIPRRDFVVPFAVGRSSRRTRRSWRSASRCGSSAPSGANSRHGGTKPGNVNGLAPILDSPDAMLAAHGVLFLRDPELWAAYETAVRVAAQRVVPRRNGRAPRKPGSPTPLSDAERAEILRRLGAGEKPKAVAKAVGRSLPIVYQLRSGAR